MSYIKPKFRHPELQTNQLGLTKVHYEGALSTLCAGCGHDSISASIIDACFELSVPPHKVAKLSGIGCSSKTPAYFLGRSHSFNCVHGRMPAIATGAHMANRDLLYLGVSGDGDTASIGLGQFSHLVRRNLNMLYIVMNNGCYGLTKGQDSATADPGSASKKGKPNPYSAIDLCELAIQLGSGFVARSFSGDKTQLIPLIKAGLHHKGFSLIDVVSPCVTFNNTPKSTKSYSFTRAHAEATGHMDYVPLQKEIETDYPADSTQEIQLHDGSHIYLRKADSEIDVTDSASALATIEHYKEQGQILTGLIYSHTESQDTHSILNTSQTPLNQLSAKALCPGQSFLDKLNAQLS